jgi:hypothetical protein
MRPLMNVKHRDHKYFHLHPHQSMFGLIASLALAALVVIAMLLTLSR